MNRGCESAFSIGKVSKGMYSPAIPRSLCTHSEKSRAHWGNNVVDLQAALSLILEFPADAEAAVAILKHNTPCGVGSGATQADAYRRAFATDPESPFGGVIASNRPFDLELAEEVDKIFTEVLVAPDFSDEALAL